MTVCGGLRADHCAVWQHDDEVLQRDRCQLPAISLAEQLRNHSAILGFVQLAQASPMSVGLSQVSGTSTRYFTRISHFLILMLVMPKS